MNQNQKMTKISLNKKGIKKNPKKLSYQSKFFPINPQSYSLEVQMTLGVPVVAPTVAPKETA